MAWGSNNDAGRDAVRRTLKGGGGSGRVTFLVIAVIFLVLGIYGHALALSIPSAIAVVWAAWAVVQVGWRRRQMRQIGRRGRSDGPEG